MVKKKTKANRKAKSGDKRLGNEFWKMRSSHGRNPIFETPEALWTAACEYFEWVDSNPLYETKAFAFQGVITQTTLPKMRAMTISGLCIFLDISETAWYSYCAKEDFSWVTTRIDKIIKTQKFEGASADLLNANIIARDLGLADKSDARHTMSVTISQEESGIL